MSFTSVQIWKALCDESCTATQDYYTKKVKTESHTTKRMIILEVAIRLARYWKKFLSESKIRRVMFTKSQIDVPSILDSGMLFHKCSDTG